MRKLVLSVLTLVSSTFLVACGGSSDSSDGTNNGTEPFGFAKYSQCEIRNNLMIVPVYDIGCKAKHHALNKGEYFALKCQRAGFVSPSGSGSVTPGEIKETYKLEVIGSKSANIRSVVNDINKNGVNSVYKYYCVK